MSGVEGRKRGECSGKNMVEICKIDLDDFDIPKRVAKANLKLIAAALSLYEALKEALDWMEAVSSEMHKMQDGDRFDGAPLTMARDALSAAEGGV